MIVPIKSKSEMDGFRNIGKITAKIFKEIVSNIKVGITTNDLDCLARDLCQKNSVKPVFLGYKNYPAALCTSLNDILVHGIPDDTILQKGDLLKIDFGAIDIDGFIGDVADSFIVEGPDIGLIEMTRSSLSFGISEMFSGNTLNEVQKAIWLTINKPMFRYFDYESNEFKSSNYTVPLEYGGHGVSRNKLHDDPFIMNYVCEQDNFVLRNGMVFAIEPMVIAGNNKLYVLKNGWSVQASGPCVHCEHTVLINENGEPEILTSWRS